MNKFVCSYTLWFLVHQALFKTLCSVKEKITDGHPQIWGAKLGIAVG